jgi:hypothetical protein
MLVSGARESGKSFAVCHKDIRHLWETPDARLALFSRVLKDSKDAGTWRLMHQFIMPEWVKNVDGFEYTTKTSAGNPGPKVDGTTRTPMFRIRNYFGGESECMLFSLEHARDVEDVLKEKMFSMIHFCELDKFDDRGVLSVALSCLRMPHLRNDQMMWIADTNPSEQGQQFWAYRVWYEERVWSYDEYRDCCARENRKPLDKEAFLEFQKGLQLVEMKPEDNIKLKPGRLAQLKADNAYDPIRYARLVDSQWVWGLGGENYHFRGIFKPDQHVIGNCDSADERDWQYANPSPLCFELVTGWDIGDGVNHAQVSIECRPVIVGGKELKCFTVLDETESLGERVSTEDFTVEVMDQIAGLEKVAGHPFDLERSWSDNSSMDYDAAANTYPYLVVWSASGYRINLEGLKLVEKNQRIRVQLVKQLLHQGRLKISAHCKGVIRSLENLKRGDLKRQASGRVHYILPDENKHLFDALSYALIKECAEELATMNLDDSAVGRRDSFIVSV